MIKPGSKWLLRRLLRIGPVRQFLEDELIAQNPILRNPQVRWAPPGHFYSPLPDTSCLEQRRDTVYYSSLDGVEMNAEGQRKLLDELGEFAQAFDWPEERVPDRRFWLRNTFFEHGDSAVLFSMIRRFHPRNIIEVGSGFSSALMLDTNEFFCESSMQLTFIEPYPERLNQLLKPRDATAVHVKSTDVQRIPLADFEILEAGDFLFIDSSHVSKFASDVNFLFFSVFPRLRPGVIVHIHDIFFPLEYPISWLREGRAWNEAYLLHAFLQYNHSFEVLLFNSFIASKYPDDMKRLIPLMSVNPGGSFWLRKL